MPERHVVLIGRIDMLVCVQPKSRRHRRKAALNMFAGGAGPSSGLADRGRHLHALSTTGVVVATGQHMSPAELEARSGLEVRFRCSACGQVRTWTRSQVRLADLPGATSRS